MVSIKTFTTTTLHRFLSTLVHIWTLLKAVRIIVTTLFSLKPNVLFLSPNIFFSAFKFLLIFELVDSGFFQRVLRHHINGLTYVNFLEHGDSCVFRKDKWISAYFWLNTFRGILTGTRTLWTILSVFPSDKLCALCLSIMLTGMTIFLPYDARIWWKSAALNLDLIIFKGFILVDLRSKPVAILIHFLLFLEITFCTEVGHRRAIF